MLRKNVTTTDWKNIATFKRAKLIVNRLESSLVLNKTGKKNLEEKEKKHVM